MARCHHVLGVRTTGRFYETGWRFNAGLSWHASPCGHRQSECGDHQQQRKQPGHHAHIYRLTANNPLRNLARERQVEIEIDLPETPVAIAGDREELLRPFENLIENALKYGASGGRVIVSLSQVASGEGAPEVRVTVRDFGPGIARLTERFYRVDVGDSRAQGGTGLGLSLVKHILNRHRGRLLIESVPKNGAVFTACFPQAKAPSTHWSQAISIA
jgi:signal transduction histidine kinase